MYTNIIYDFDGTISDSYPVMTRAFVAALAECGIKADYAEIYPKLKISLRHCMAQYPEAEGLSAHFHKIYEETAPREARAMDGAAEICSRALSRGKRNYIYTHSGAYIRKMLLNMGLGGMFTGIVTSEDGYPHKPDPAALNALGAKFAFEKSSALMVGDRDIDVIAARNAGIAGCLLDPDGFYAGAQCDYYIKSLRELENIIK